MSPRPSRKSDARRSNSRNTESRRRRASRRTKPKQFLFETLEDRRLLATITVTSAADNTTVDGAITLREAILAANTNAAVDGSEAGDSGADTITFDPNVFTGGNASLIRLTQGELEVTETLFIDASTATDVVITGDANADDVTLPGTFITDVTASSGVLSDNDRVLNFSSSAGDLTLNGLTITGGRTGDGMDAFVDNGSVVSATSSEDGGGILFDSDGVLNLATSTVSGNSTGVGGEGLGAPNGSSGGNGGKGGGISISSGAVTLTNSTVSGNSTGAGGGGVYGGLGGKGGGINADVGTVTLNNSTVSGNFTGAGGSAERFAGYGGEGGGIFVRSGAVVLTNSTVSGNSTGAGGDGTGTYGIAGNGGNGGGIYTLGDTVGVTTVTVNNSTISGNSTGKGGIGSVADGLGGDGGGIFTLRGAATLTNSTLSNNSTGASPNNQDSFGGNGGGIYATLGGVNLISSTVANNAAVNTGGGIHLRDSSPDLPLSIENSIIAGNTDTGTAPDLLPDPGGALTINYSLIGDTTGSGIISSTGTGNVLNQAALLGPLTDNGGPTLTHALLVGSPAFNTGDPSIAGGTDQRGLSRVQFDRADIGAFEVQPQIPVGGLVVSTTDDIIDYDFSSGQLSLREAIFLAKEVTGSDTITFDAAVFDGVNENSLIRLTQGELEVTETLFIDASTATDVVITGDANADDVTLPGTFITDVASSTSANSLGDNSRVLNLSTSTADLTLEGLTITGGRTTGSDDGGGILFNSDGTLSLTSSNVSGNTSASRGGGIYTIFGAVTLTASTVSGNSAAGTYGGGGIYTRTGAVTLNSSTVSGNTTTGNFSSGGGISTRSGAVTLHSSTVSGNTSASRGGGIYAFTGAVTLNSSMVSGNTNGRGSGGGIWGASGAVTLNSSTVSGNTSALDGGGISTFFGAVTLNSSTVSGNTGDDGGGIWTESGVVTLTSSTVSGNTSDDDGGGISTRSGAVTLNSSTVSGNTSDGDGGGISTYYGAVTLNSSTVSGNTSGRGGGISTKLSGVVTLTSSTVSGNTSRNQGGGIFMTYGVVTLTSSTVSGNTSGRGGGGIWTKSGAVTLNSSTVTLNDTMGSGGGVYINDFFDSPFNFFFTVENSIIAGNTDDGTAPDLHPDPDSTLTINYSLIGVADNLGTITGDVGNLTGTAASPLDAMLGPLADNGGPTQTHALLPGSPAIDAGNSTETLDQRGLARVVDQAGVANAAGGNGSDIGAFERQPTPTVTTTLRDEGGVLERPDLLTTYEVTFNVDVNVNVNDLIIRNDTLGGTVVDTSGLTLDYSSGSNTATWDFAGLILAPAFYSFELSTDIVSVIDNLSLDGDNDGNPGGAFIESVYVAIPGDLNLDGQVNVLGDAFDLIGNLGTTGGATWAQGDFNDDGNVNVLGDAFTLVGQLGESVVPPMMSIASSTIESNPEPMASVQLPPEPTTIAFATYPSAVSSEQEEDDDQPLVQPSSAPLQLAGNEELDAAFESDGMIDDGLF